MSKFIFMICPGRSGSSILANTFRNNGMWAGDKQTFWHDRFDYHCEHSILTACGSRLVNGVGVWKDNIDSEERIWLKNVIENPSDESVMMHIDYILKQYANKEKDFTGVKITTISPDLINVFAEIAKTIFSEIFFFTTLRHPVSYIRGNLDNDVLLKGWLGNTEGIEEIMKLGGAVVPFPSYWQKDKEIKNIIKATGLNWDNRSIDMFTLDMVNDYTKDKKLMKEFINKYPYAEKKYQKLFDVVDNLIGEN